jgi:peptidoglycan/xylan/chitin deacetylase (PgdA/CDA1 family)
MRSRWKLNVLGLAIALAVALAAGCLGYLNERTREIAEDKRLQEEVIRREQEQIKVEADAERLAEQAREEAARKEIRPGQPPSVTSPSDPAASAAAQPPRERKDIDDPVAPDVAAAPEQGPRDELTEAMPEPPAAVEPPASPELPRVAVAPLPPVRPQAPLVPIQLAPARKDIAVECAGRDVLGTSRILPIGPQGGLTVGFKTYPRDLRLADHEVVLTFDDGPLPETTPHVLDVLKENCVHATFFLIGKYAQANPSLVKREIAEGQTVGHHSFSHPDITLRGMSDAEAREEIEAGFIADEEAGYQDGQAGVLHVPFFRFPGFADTKPLLAWLASRNIAVFGCDVWASDWWPMTPQAQLKLVMSRLEKSGRGIILLHDSRLQVAAMLESLLIELKAHGYRVVHLVPGTGHTETVPAPPGWTSETEEVIAKTLPKLLARAGRSMPKGDVSPIASASRFPKSLPQPPPPSVPMPSKRQDE